MWKLAIISFLIALLQNLFGRISELLNVSVGTDFESVARWWLSNNKNSVINVVCTVSRGKRGQVCKIYGEEYRWIWSNGRYSPKMQFPPF
jgi:hypothetical protein